MLFEASLSDAMTLLNKPSYLKAEAKVGEINQEDAAYWSVKEVTLPTEDVDDWRNPMRSSPRH